jgi:hypothetical protein
MLYLGRSRGSGNKGGSWLGNDSDIRGISSLSRTLDIITAIYHKRSETADFYVIISGEELGF